MNKLTITELKDSLTEMWATAAAHAPCDPSIPREECVPCNADAAYMLLKDLVIDELEMLGVK